MDFAVFNMAAERGVAPYAIACGQGVGMGGKDQRGSGAATLDAYKHVEAFWRKFFDLRCKAQITQGPHKGLCHAAFIAGGIRAFTTDQRGQQFQLLF